MQKLLLVKRERERENSSTHLILNQAFLAPFKGGNWQESSEQIHRKWDRRKGSPDLPSCTICAHTVGEWERQRCPSTDSCCMCASWINASPFLMCCLTDREKRKCCCQRRRWQHCHKDIYLVLGVGLTMFPCVKGFNVEASKVTRLLVIEWGGVCVRVCELNW